MLTVLGLAALISGTAGLCWTGVQFARLEPEPEPFPEPDPED